MSLDTVISTARAIVAEPPTKIGYSDVGDVLVRYLRNEIDSAAAVEKLECLSQDYAAERSRAELRAAAAAITTMPSTIAIVGKNATWARASAVFDLSGTAAAWMRHVKVVQRDADLDQLRGLRGPDVWWVDWGATMEQKIFCRTREFKAITAERAHDTLDKLKAGWKR